MLNHEEKVIEKYKSRIGNQQLKAIRAHCVECTGGQVQRVTFCISSSCSLYPYRMGHQNPKGLIWVPKPGDRGSWLPNPASSEDEEDS